MRRVAPLAVALLAAVVFTARPTYDPDLFWHLAQGREVLSGHFVHTNLFSAATAAYPQSYTSWGFEVVLATLVRAVGLDGAQLAQCVLITLACLTLYASARVRHSSVAAMSVLLISLWVLEPRAMPRPYLISWIGLGMCANLAERWMRGRDVRLASFFLLIVLWANLHSEAVLGAGFVGLFGLCEWAQLSESNRSWAARIIVVGALGVVATLVTPYGVGVWRYLAENALVPNALRIAELQPPTFATYPAFFVYLAVLAALLVSQPRAARLSEVAIAVVFAGLGLRYIRFTPLVVFATAPIVASRLDALMRRGWDRRAVMITAVAVMLVTAPASPARMLRAWRMGPDAVAPADVFSSRAVPFARVTGLSGPLFNSMNLGGYLAWAMPEARVFQDSRLQAYPPQHFAAILGASESPEQWRVLVKDVDWAMVSLARPNELSGVGKFAPEEWAPVFRDRAVEVLVRRAGRFAEIARTLEISTSR